MWKEVGKILPRNWQDYEGSLLLLLCLSLSLLLLLCIVHKTQCIEIYLIAGSSPL